MRINAQLTLKIRQHMVAKSDEEAVRKLCGLRFGSICLRTQVYFGEATGSVTLLSQAASQLEKCDDFRRQRGTLV
jgi:hypothetical protein